VLQVAPVYRRARLANLAPTATSRALANIGDWTFLMAPNDSLQGEFIGAFADTALGARTAAIFYAPDEYGIGLATGTEAALARRGVRLLDRVPVRGSADCLDARGVAAYEGLAAELARRGTPDVIVVASRAIESACLLRAMRAKWPGIRLIAGDGAYVDELFFRRAGGRAEDSYFVAFWHPALNDTASMAFAKGFEQATGRAPRHGDAIFYDAVMLAAAAVHEAGANRRLVRDYLATIGARRTPFQGIAGPVGFTDSTRRALLMTHIKDGTVRVVGVR
jgi:branched-chain amino acid transport system substrate-binding protein